MKLAALHQGLGSFQTLSGPSLVAFGQKLSRIDEPELIDLRLKRLFTRSCRSPAAKRSDRTPGHKDPRRNPECVSYSTPPRPRPQQAIRK